MQCLTRNALQNTTKFSVLILVVIFIAFALYRSKDAGQDHPRVNTTLGIIEGFYNVTNEGKRYEAYTGIPFAFPTTGDQRFEIAEPITPWTGILNAKAFGSSCLQLDESFVHTRVAFVSGSEDCLYLNVYAPVVNRKNKRGTSADLVPVIFYIFGGAFQYGSGTAISPEYILNKDVIFVTSNYRVGPLGFLSTEDDTIPGNMGLKDQVTAMRWVKDNILYFGGDPERITLIGHSSGAACVHYHYLTNLTAGLFQRGISMSGNALNCWAQTENSLEKAKRLATIVKCPTSDVSRMVDCLKTRPGDEIILASVQFRNSLGLPSIPFGPVVEKGCNWSKFIDQPPIALIITGKVQDRSWITTAVSQEGLPIALEFIINATLLEEMNNNWVDIAPHLLDFNYTIPESDKSDVALLIRQHYLGTSSIDNSTINRFVKIISDRMYGYDFAKAAMLQAQAIESPVRFSSFSYRGAHGGSEQFTGDNTNLGVGHGDDVSYVVKIIFDPTTTKRDREMQKMMIDLWVSYATDGVPDVGVEWPSIDASQEEFKYLHIAGPDEIFMDGSLNYGDKNFWQSIPFYENIILP